VCSAALGASAPTEGGEGRGHIVAAARLQLVVIIKTVTFCTIAVYQSPENPSKVTSYFGQLFCSGVRVLTIVPSAGLSDQ